MFSKNMLNYDYKNFKSFDQIVDFVKKYKLEELIEYCVCVKCVDMEIRTSENEYNVNSQKFLEISKKISVGFFKEPFVGGATLFDTLTDLYNNIDKYIFVYSLLSDEESRKTFLNYILYRMFVDISYLNEVTSNEQQYYINDIFSESNNEVFVDCGAYNGDTIMQYIEFRKNDYKKIYVYEPAIDNIEKINQNTVGLHDINIINRGVWSSNDVLTFSSHMPDSANRILPGGDIVVQVSTIDTDIHEKINFIKMDIEGAELDALLGARTHIISDRPKLAICVYHTVQDIWKIPQFIYNCNNKQKFYLRYHGTNVPEELVFYANPEPCFETCCDENLEPSINNILELIETMYEAVNQVKYFLLENKQLEAIELLSLTSEATKTIQKSIENLTNEYR